MRTYIRFCWLFLGLLACSKSTPEPQFSTSASLNGELWKGYASTWHNPYDVCTVTTFNLALATLLPSTRGENKTLVFTKVPLAPGKYPVSISQPCQSSDTVGAAYSIVFDGDISLKHYSSLAQAGWLTITSYVPRTGRIEGNFDVTLAVDKLYSPAVPADTIRFTSGHFVTTLTN